MKSIHALFFVTVTFFSGSASAQETSPDSSNRLDVVVREWGLPAYQEAELAKDAPIKDMVVTHDGNLWSVGRTAAWRWDLAQNSLQRIQLILEPKQELAKITRDGESVFVGSRQFVFQIQNDGKVFRYKIPGRTGEARPIGFAGSGDHLVWITNKKVFRFDRYGKKFLPLSGAVDLRDSDQVIGIKGTDDAVVTLVVARGRELFKLTFSASSVARSAIQKFSNPVVGLFPDGNGYLAHTAFSITRQNHLGKRLQTIPVENDRRLLKAHVNEFNHLYCFDDGLVEIFNLKDENSKSYHLPVALMQNLEEIAQAGSQTILRTKGKLFAFSEVSAVARDNGAISEVPSETKTKPRISRK